MKINLIPLHLRASQKKNEFILLSCLVLFLNIFLMALLHILLSYEIQKLNLHKIQLFNQLSVVSVAIKNLQKIKKQSDQLKATKQVLSINHEQIRKILSLLDAMQALPLPDFFIKTVCYEKSNVVISGASKSEKSLLKLIKILRNTYFLNCKYYSKHKGQMFKFILNISL